QFFGALDGRVAPRIVDIGHRHAPLRHRAFRIEPRGLLKRAVGFVVPERMQERQSLVEECLRLIRFGSDRHVNLSGAFKQTRGRGRFFHLTWGVANRSLVLSETDGGAQGQETTGERHALNFHAISSESYSKLSSLLMLPQWANRKVISKLESLLYISSLVADSF